LAHAAAHDPFERSEYPLLHPVDVHDVIPDDMVQFKQFDGQAVQF
jgi:hypothetical protein